MDKINKLRHYAKAINTHLYRLFDRSHLNALARVYKFVQRASSQLEGYEFIDLVSWELLCVPSMSYEAMIERLQELNSSIDMSPQALSKRINKEAAVSYIKALFHEVMQIRISELCSDLDEGLLAPFSRVFVQDGTTLSLHERLSEHFRGCGGAASASALEIDLLVELKAQTIHHIAVHEATCLKEDKPDSLSILQPGDMIIRDLGYFCLETFKKIAAMGAFFLSRLLPQTNLYLDEHSAEPVALGSYLETHFAHLSVIDLTVYIGQKARLPVRLVCYRLPDEIVSKRRREARKNARKKGRNCTKAHLDRLAFGLYITNVDQAIFSAEQVATVYRIRWQIELMFKHWKSLLHIDLLKGTRPERILCLVYGRLICILILSLIYQVALYFAHQEGREISYHKLILWLQRNNRLAQAIRCGDVIPLIEQMEQNISRLCKQKRKRKTTNELITEGIPYFDASQEPQHIHKAA